MIAMGKHFHPNCFTCKGWFLSLGLIWADCGKELGTSFFLKDDAPLCESCIKSGGTVVGSVTCEECGGKISGTYVNYENKGYHNFCFKCYGCKKQLQHDAFYTKQGKVGHSVCSHSQKQHCKECAMK